MERRGENNGAAMIVWLILATIMAFCAGVIISSSRGGNDDCVIASGDHAIAAGRDVKMIYQSVPVVPVVVEKPKSPKAAALPKPTAAAPQAQTQPPAPQPPPAAPVFFEQSMVAEEPILFADYASRVGFSSARLNGRFNFRGQEGALYFEYSAFPLFGWRKSSPNYIWGTENNLVVVVQDVFGLIAGSKYYFRLVAEIEGRRYISNLQCFRTASRGYCPSPPSPPSSPSDPPHQPPHDGPNGPSSGGGPDAPPHDGAN